MKSSMKNNFFSVEEITEALMRVVNTATPLERAQSLQANCEVLLTDEATALLSNNLEEAKQAGDGEAVQVILSVLSLLALSREKGVDAGLAELADQETKYIASRLQPFVENSSWVEKKRLLEKYPKALLNETARQMLENLLQANQHNPDAVLALKNASALLDAARKMGIPEAIQWLQEQLLGGLANLVSVGDLMSGSFVINELRSITEAEKQVSINMRIADTLIEHSRGEADHEWIVDQISGVFDQTSTSVMSVALHSKLVDFLLTAEDEDRIEQAMIRLCTVLEGWEKAGYSFEGVYGNIGRSFLFRDRGDQQENLRMAREYLEHELEIGAKKENLDNLAATHRLLGLMHMRLGDRQAAIQHLEQGISLDPTKSTEAFAGAALDLRKLRIGKQGVGNQVALDEAINDLAWGLVGAPDNTGAWAWIHANLGDLYRQRQAGDPAENLKQAYEHTNLALGVFIQETHENEWAQMQHNLGTIYLFDSFHDRADNLEKAIDCFKNALGVHTRENYPLYFGLTKFSLGIALMQRILGKHERNYKEALQYLQEAEAVLELETSKIWWAECMTALGQIYRSLTLPDRIQNLRKAVEYMEKAHGVYAGLGNKERETQMISNLAAIHMDLGVFEPGAYKKALQFAETAIRVTNRETDPYQWAIYSRNMAGALENQAQTTAADHKRALENIQNALEIFTPDAYLADYRQSINDLGHLYF